MIKVGDRVKVMTNSVNGTTESKGAILTVMYVSDKHFSTTISPDIKTKLNLSTWAEWHFEINSLIKGELAVLDRFPRDINYVKDTACVNHNWASYTGFTQIYRYCVICDKKDT